MYDFHHMRTKDSDVKTHPDRGPFQRSECVNEQDMERGRDLRGNHERGSVRREEREAHRMNIQPESERTVAVVPS
jgi:hypothetical protein